MVVGRLLRSSTKEYERNTACANKSDKEKCQLEMQSRLRKLMSRWRTDGWLRNGRIHFTVRSCRVVLRSSQMRAHVTWRFFE